MPNKRDLLLLITTLLLGATHAHATTFATYDVISPVVSYDIPKGSVVLNGDKTIKLKNFHFLDTKATTDNTVMSGAKASVTVWGSNGAHCTVTGTVGSDGNVSIDDCGLYPDNYFSLSATITSTPVHTGGAGEIEVQALGSDGAVYLESAIALIRDRWILCSLKDAIDKVVLKPGVPEPVTQNNTCNLSWASGIGTLTDEDTGNTVPFYNLVAGRYRATSASPNEDLSLLLGSPPTGGTYKGSETIIIDAP